ncbi:hypothetical protein RhiLY_09659 [Ceratobasidium sp. AG-Ba]|nr:hypothetical protein RhiLY_09659 [Ceratobasidium sp. AG-Ba]
MLNQTGASNTSGDSSSQTGTRQWGTTILAEPPFVVPSQPKPRGKFVDHFRKVARTKSSSRSKSSITKKHVPPRKRHLNLPELVHDSTVSEESTPVSTPIHPEFDFRRAQGEIADKAGRGLSRYGQLPLALSPLAGRSKGQHDEDSKAWFTRGPPMAPRIDTGTFDTTYHDLSFGSSENTSFSSMDAPVPFLLPTMEPPILPSLEREQSYPSRIEMGTENPRFSLPCPPAPRPDAGSWSHSTHPNGLAMPGPLLPGIPTWMLNAPRPSCRLLPRSSVSSSWPRPSPNWNTGLGLNLDAIADIPGSPLGENESMRGDLECELCLAEQFPGMPRTPRGFVGTPFCPVAPVPTTWSTVAHHGAEFNGQYGLGLGRGLNSDEGRRLSNDARTDGYAPMALGYGSMCRCGSGHHDQSEQSVSTRPVEPIMLAEPVCHNGVLVSEYTGTLLPPIELGRRRVGN